MSRLFGRRSAVLPWVRPRAHRYRELNDERAPYEETRCVENYSYSL